MIKKLLRVLFVLALLPVVLWLLVVRPSFFEYANPVSSTNNPLSADSQKLQQHVRVLSEQFSPRSINDVENLNRAADYIKTALTFDNSLVKLQSYSVEGETYHNVVAIFGPSTGSAVVVGAHYDAYAQLPGADDNASGVAGLLELARLLSTTELKRQIILVAYTLEEPPAYNTEKMGSVIHALSIVEDGIDVDYMISLEMIGYFDDAANTQAFPLPFLSWFYPTTGNFIAVVGELTSNTARSLRMTINEHTSVPAYSISAPKVVVGVDFSDHRSYWAQGIDAVMVTDTSFFRNLAYHTPDDTADKLDYQRMAEIVNGVRHFVIDD